MSRGSFPTEVQALVQYGPKLRALAVYLHEYRLLPLGRVSELLSDCYGSQVSEATVQTWVELAAERLAPVVAQIADWLSDSRIAFELSAYPAVTVLVLADRLKEVDRLFLMHLLDMES